MSKTEEDEIKEEKKARELRRSSRIKKPRADSLWYGYCDPPSQEVQYKGKRVAE